MRGGRVKAGSFVVALVLACISGGGGPAPAAPALAASEASESPAARDAVGGAGPRSTAGAGSALGALSAMSADGRLVLLAQETPPCLVVLDATRGVPVHTIVPASREGRIATHIAALQTAALRRSFIVAPADLPELWEISYDPKAEDLYDGLVHDYRFGEGVPRRGYLGLRRTALAEPLADFVLDEHEAEAWGLAAAPPAGSGEGQVINLDVRRRVATVPAAQMTAQMQERAQRPAHEASAARAGAPSSAQADTDLAQRRTASRPWPCTVPKVPGP